MRRNRRARTRLVRSALVAFALAALIGFAAEPTTSTQFDVLEGRGVAVVHGAHDHLAAAQRAIVRPEPEPIAPIVLGTLALGLSLAVLARRAHDAGGRLPSLLGRVTLARRGPPALV